VHLKGMSMSAFHAVKMFDSPRIVTVLAEYCAQSEKSDIETIRDLKRIAQNNVLFSSFI
jgi:hypothetical protein